MAVWYRAAFDVLFYGLCVPFLGLVLALLLLS